MTLSFHSTLFRQRCTIPVSRSVCTRVQLVIRHGFQTCKQWKANSFTCWLESIVLHSHNILKSSGVVHYCHSSILSEFCDRGSTRFEVYFQWSINLALPIDSDCLQVQSFGQSNASFDFLGLFRCLFRASYDWNSRLHVLLLSVLFQFIVQWNAHFTSFWTGQNGTKTSPSFWLLLYLLLF